jgi:serine/threonine protein kinase
MVREFENEVELLELFGPQSTSQFVMKGFHKILKRPVVIKFMRFSRITDLNLAVREAFIQAKLNHPLICSALDVNVKEYEGGFELCLCMEEMESDLQAQITDRMGMGQKYGEFELMQFLRGMVDALESAQAHVLFT